MDLVQLVQQVELPALFGQGDVVVFDVLDQFVDLRAGRVYRRALKSAGQERGAQVVRADAARGQGNEAWKILVFRAEAVSDPGPDAGLYQAERPGVHHQRGRVVVRNIRSHRADDRDVVDMLADERKDLADGQAAFSHGGEFEW